VRAAQASFAELVEALNEGETSARRDLLENCWADEGTFDAPSFGKAGNRSELSGLVTKKFRDRAYWVEQKGKAIGTDGRIEAKWEIKRSDHQPLKQKVTARINSSGRFTALRASNVPARDSRFAKLTTWATQNPLALLPVALAALYVVLRIPVTLFYNDLGVTPEEVGQGDAVVLRNSLILLVVLVAAAALVGPLYLLFLKPQFTFGEVTRRLRRQNRRHARFALGLLVLPPLGLYLGLLLVVSLTTSATALAIVFVSFGLGSALTYIFGPTLIMRLYRPAARVREIAADRVRRSGEVSGNWIEAAAGGLIGLAVVILLVVLPIEAMSAAGNVRQGDEAGGRFLPWRALPARVDYLDAKIKPPFVNDCKSLRYLGESNGRAIFFDSAMDAAFRVPSDEIIISLGGDCDSGPG
jgi:hypothetical protein